MADAPTGKSNITAAVATAKLHPLAGSWLGPSLIGQCHNPNSPRGGQAPGEYSKRTALCESSGR